MAETIILDGKKTAEKLTEKLKEQVKKLDKKPKLAVLLVGDDPASLIYVNSKLKKAQSIGFETVLEHFPQNTAEEIILEKISDWNITDEITGILVQLPLPKHLNKEKILNEIDVEKDVDGLTNANSGRFYTGNKDCITPCTTRGIEMLLDEYGIEVEGRHAVVVGRSNLVGKPTAQMLLNRNATVTICHSKTKNLDSIIKTADILISAVGEKIINGKILKENCVVIDVGIIRTPDGKITGDVDFNSALGHASFISPVPGGVGPMTVTALMWNLWELNKRH